MNGNDRGKRRFGEKLLEVFGIVNDDAPDPSMQQGNPQQGRYPQQQQPSYQQQQNQQQQQYQQQRPAQQANPYGMPQQRPANGPQAQWQPRKAPADGQYGAQGQGSVGYVSSAGPAQRPAQDPYGMGYGQQTQQPAQPQQAPAFKVYQGGKAAHPVQEYAGEPQSIMSVFIRELRDCYKAIDCLMRGVVVLAGLSEKNVVGDTQLKFYEVLYGAAVALQAQIMRLGNDWVIIVPKNVNLVGDVQGEMRRSGMADPGYVRR